MKKGISRVLLLLFAASLVFLVLVFSFRRPIERRLFESLFNQNTKEFFDGSIRLEEARLDPKLKIHLRNLRGQLHSDAGPVPFEISSIDSQGPLFDFFSKEGLALIFKGLRPGHSAHQGVQGTIHLRGGREGFADLKAEVKSLDLQEVEWLNPENLSGASGELRGEVTFRVNAAGEVLCAANLRVQEPGGRIQSRFFDILKPYLPQQLEIRQKMDHLIATGGIVGFHDASLQLELAKSDQMKVFLHIAIPDYNLVLNLNIDIRIDEKNAFLQLAQLAGLLKVTQ